MQTPNRRPRHLTPFLLISVGLGLCGWYGLAWRDLPQYSAADIEGSVEANLAVDLARMGPQLQPDEEGLMRLRAQVRTEVQAEITREREQVQQGLAAGLICLVLAAGHFVFMRLIGENPRA